MSLTVLSESTPGAEYRVLILERQGLKSREG